MFAYCGNNPVCYCDPFGYASDTACGINNKFCLDLNIGLGGGIVILPNPHVIDTLVDAIEDTKQKIIAFAESSTDSSPRDQSVYTLSDSNGMVRYVGRTNDPVRRLYQHQHDPLHPWRREYTMNVVASGLTLKGAKLFEQALISAYSITYLENMRREISVGNLQGYRQSASALTELIYGVDADVLFEMMGG